MRRKVIAGNWKMNNDLTESQNLISRIVSLYNSLEVNSEVILCPPFTSLSEAASILKGTGIKLGAQNMHFEDSGAYTGEISVTMLTSAGCEYVILGHSERRHIFNESDEMINKKLKKAVESGLKPIFCVGELLEEREKGITEKVIEEQLSLGLKNFSNEELNNVIIAYEPVWAIGTGKTASPEQAQEVHRFIRSFVLNNFSEANAQRLIIQYGGSVKPDNAAQLLSQEDIDGALVGGACLKAESFIDIVKSS